VNIGVDKCEIRHVFQIFNALVFYGEDEYDGYDGLRIFRVKLMLKTSL